MSDTLTRRILQELVDRLEQILVENGFNTDAGEDVGLGVRSFDDLAEGEIVVGVYRGKTTVSDAGQPRLAITLPVIVEAHYAPASDPAGSIENLVGDLKKACMLDHDRTLGGLATGFLKLVSDEVFYPAPGSSIASARLTFTASIRESYGNPYSSS